MKQTKLILECILCAILIGAGIRVYIFLSDLDSSLKHTQPAIQTLLSQASAAATNLNLASQEQRQYWNKTSAESAKTVRSLRQLIDRTDRSLNDSLLPQLEVDASQTNTEAVATIQDLDRNLKSLQPSLENLSNATASLDRTLADPQIQTGIDATAASAQNIQETSKHLAATTADIQEAVHRETRPASFAMKTGTFILHLAVDFGSILGGLIHP